METVPNSMGNQMDLMSRVSKTASRLSIIVPLQSDALAFEETLISILENRPADTEILVCHDGRYDDPFDLCDEVKFVQSDSTSLVDLVAAGARVAMGRFTHVLASGVIATPGWTDAALEKFEHFDCGSVAPVIRDRHSNRIIAAGWEDSATRLCRPASRGRKSIKQPSSQSVGAFLQASFWRTDLLCSLADAFVGSDVTAASVAYEHLASGAGWRCVVADQCDVVCEQEVLQSEISGFNRGRTLRGLQNHFYGGGWSTSLQSSAVAALGCIVKPGLFSEAIGQAFGAVGSKSLAKRIHSEDVLCCDDRAEVLEFKQAEPAMPQRRAA
ncbi:hypothetical protein LF1_39370 [Rubripirellula obstinata]|uniref:Glycosyl transferase family 2 n=1 Tax=Rubripirellula obstinata TaxID=406547 RepID=A0A5B1CP57_9BACT|nr:hypothetical protein [Rubripirellula obstinata]KAA1261390.1 hypothetical protein LF1_39370 [Rubripirellula obstinata]